jgi:lipopolysaccharide/colanic/teichoic acid biosynthesis glycosyltransferase
MLTHITDTRNEIQLRLFNVNSTTAIEQPVTMTSYTEEYPTMSLVSEMSQSTTERSATGPQFWKSTMDCILVLVLLVPASFAMLVAMVLVRLTSRGPVIYPQIRLGHNGRRYTIYKIRSMYQDCERLTGPRWSTPGDKRVTWIGKFLRAFHIDELPQLWNIFKGDMSLVGPRPERPELVVGLELAIPCYRDRLQVRPGVTGLAQVQLPPDTDLDSVRRKVAYDLYYIEHASLWLDFRLILATALGIVRIPPSLISALLAIPDSDTVERAYRDRSGEMDTIPARTVEPRAHANLA